jgi:NTE family protein
MMLSFLSYFRFSGSLRLARRMAAVASWLVLSACTTTVHNAPGNRCIGDRQWCRGRPARDIAGTNLVALSFSGGGLRAAAFSFGVLKALDANSKPGDNVLDDVTFISSVSGGSLTAAYYGLHGKAGLSTFPQQGAAARHGGEHAHVCLCAGKRLSCARRWLE